MLRANDLCAQGHRDEGMQQATLPLAEQSKTSYLLVNACIHKRVTGLHDGLCLHAVHYFFPPGIEVGMRTLKNNPWAN
eukprot:1044738-Pelagomonas_calceolata.AAC.1